MSFDSLSGISGFILIISILLIACGLEVFASRKRIGICVLIFSVICFSVSLKIFCSIDDDLYHSSNNSYSIKFCDMDYEKDDDVLMAKDRYNISYDGYDSNIKIWAYNTEKVKGFYNRYNHDEHYYDYLEVESKQQKMTLSIIGSLIFSNSTLENFVNQNVKITSNTGIVKTTGTIRALNENNKTYYLINEYLLCGEDTDNRINELVGRENVNLCLAYDVSTANGNEFFQYKIIN